MRGGAVEKDEAERNGGGRMSDTITTVEGRELLETVKNAWQFLNREEFEKIMTIFYWAVDRVAKEMMESEE
jgi:hypothetical protein